jgi:hypothetical protein
MLRSRPWGRTCIEHRRAYSTRRTTASLATKYRKTAVTPAQLTRAGELGTKLQAQFKSRRAKRSKREDRPRPPIGATGSGAFLRLWSVEALVFGRAVDDHVPALQALRRQSTAAKRAAKAQKAAAHGGKGAEGRREVER